MKKITQRLLCLFVLLLCSVSSWADRVQIDGIYYSLSEKGWAFVDNPKRSTGGSTESSTYSGNIVIPEKVTYNGTTYSVEGISAFAFCNCKGLTSVTIPNSVKFIFRNAFEGCLGLTSVTIPKSLVHVEGDTFKGCYMSQLNISNKSDYNLKSFGMTIVDTEQEDGLLIKNDTAVLCRPTATSVMIPSSVKCIGEKAFAGCSGLTSVTIPNSVTSIGKEAFFKCSGLTSLTIPKSVTRIGFCAFDGCTSLTSLNINDLEAWCNISFDALSKPHAYHLFLDGKEIKHLILPNSVTRIGDYAFDGCSGLTAVTIPNSVTCIGRGAFSGCKGLTSVTIPNSVTSIESLTFAYCSNLRSITIPNTVRSIGDMYTFSNCPNLKSVTIPSSVTKIGDNIFEDCTGLTFVKIPNSVTRIGEKAFKGCKNLRSLVIPKSVTYIAENAFDDCPINVGKKSAGSSSGSNDWNSILNSFESYTNQCISLNNRLRRGDMSAATKYNSLKNAVF